MFLKLKNEVKISFTLHTKSPLSIRSKKGNVMDPSLPDMQCIKSRYNGRDSVIIPGSSLKGVMRSRYEKIVSLFGGECCNVVVRNQKCGEEKRILNVGKDDNKGEQGKFVYEKMCPACQLFGSTQIASRIRVADAYPIGRPVTGERTGVGINRITGAAQKGALYDFEVVEEGSFRVEMFLKNYELYQLRLLLYVLKDLDKGYIGLGAATTRGNGRMEVQDVEMAFREYRKGAKGLKDVYEGEKEELVDSEKYAVSYEWTSGFYGEAVLSDIKLEDMLQELSDVDIKSKVEKKRNMGGAQA